MNNMTDVEKLEETYAHIRARTNARPTVGIVLGSGLGGIAEPSVEDAVFPFGELPHFPRAGVAGHQGRIVIGSFAGATVALMQGRIHYYEGHTPQEVVYPVRLLRRLGCSTLILTAAAGSVAAAYRPGDIVVIKDHLNLSGVNCLRGPYYPEFGERFPDLSAVYDPRLRAAALKAARAAKLRVHEGVYAAMSGPSYETPAEVKALRRLGADLAGMSLVHEAACAVQSGMKVAGICFVANRCARAGKKTLSHDEVLRTAAAVAPRFAGILEAMVAAQGPRA